MILDNKRPLRAFSGGAQSRLLRGINKLANHCRNLRRVAWTADELRTLFLPPHMHYSMSQAYELQEGGSFTGGQTLYVSLTNTTPMDWPQPRMLFAYEWSRTRDGFLVPARHGAADYPAHLNEDVPTELRDKWDSVARHETRIAYEWGLVRHAFLTLNQADACTTPAQMRYLWPALVPILKAADEHELAGRLAQASARAGDSARFPAKLGPHLKTTYDIVAKGVLLSEVAEPAPVSDAISYNLVQPKFADRLGNEFDGYS